MNRFIPILVALLVGVLPAVALAQVINAPIVGPGATSSSQAQGQQQGQQQGQLQGQTLENCVGYFNCSQIQAQEQKQKVDQANVQSITTTGVPNLIQLPGLLGMPPNFTQPYKPEAFINAAGPVRPNKMTYDQAKACAGYWGFSDSWFGASRPAVTEIALYYPAWDKVAPTADMSAYTGVSTVNAADKPWVPTLCTAAKAAMENGVDVGVVEYIVRPRNDTWGIGFGSSFGGSGIPAGAALSPYALAGVAGIGTGFSRTHVKGELMLQITGMTKGSVKTSSGETLGAPKISSVPAGSGNGLGDLRRDVRQRALHGRGAELISSP